MRSAPNGPDQGSQGSNAQYSGRVSWCFGLRLLQLSDKYLGVFPIWLDWVEIPWFASPIALLLPSPVSKRHDLLD